MSYRDELKVKMIITYTQYDAIEKWAEEESNRYANWIADDYDKPEKAEWLKSVKERRKVILDIRQALIDSENIN